MKRSIAGDNLTFVTKMAVCAAACLSFVHLDLSINAGTQATDQPVDTTIAAVVDTTPAPVIEAAPAVAVVETTLPADPVVAQSVAVVKPSRSCPEFEPLFAAAGLPVKRFSYIAWRESRCTPTAYNDTLNRDKSRDYGLLQINSTWKTVTSNVCGQPWGQLDILFTVDCNIAVAKYLYDNGGLGHWRVR
jgi:hypothetical protein